MQRDDKKKVITDRMGNPLELDVDVWKGTPLGTAVNGYVKHMMGVFQLCDFTSHDHGQTLEEWAEGLRNFTFSEPVYRYCVSLLRQGKNCIIKDKHPAVVRYRRDIFEIVTNAGEGSWKGDGIAKMREEVNF